MSHDDLDRDEPFTRSELRSALGSFATGVTVVTTRDRDGSPVGLTISSFAAVSLEPPLILWSLRNESSTMSCFAENTHFAVNVLSSAQEDVCRLFSSAAPNRFASVTIRAGIGGVPLIGGVSATFECRREAVYPGGDHQILIGRVRRVSVSPLSSPLVHCRGAFLNPLEENCTRRLA